MNSSAFVLFFTFINIVLWIIFFIILKKRYSPKNVLDSIKDEVDKLLIVINQETDRDLTLLEAKLSEIHEAMKYADYVLQQAKEDQTLSNPDYGQKIEMHQDTPGVTVSISDAARTRAVPASQSAYQEEAVEWEQNMELFTGYPEKQPVRTTASVPPSSAAASSPVHQTQKNSEAGPRKVNRQQVIDLWQMGQSVAEIARRLDVDMTSVQMIIDMFS